MNRKQAIAAIRATGANITARFVEGEYRVSVDPAAIRAAYPEMSYAQSIERAESMACYEADAESAIGNASAIWESWLAEIAPQPAADDRETVRINLRRQAAGMAAIADSENAPTQALKVALARPDATRRDNVEYYAGREAFQRGEPESACPYYARDKFGDDCRHARWTLGWREARDNVPGPDAADVIGEAGTRAGIRTVDATPAWAGILPLLRAAVENGTPKGRAMAWAEIERMAALADERNRIAPAISAALDSDKPPHGRLAAIREIISGESN